MDYIIKNGKVIVSNPNTIWHGYRIRLGNNYDGILTFSDGKTVFQMTEHQSPKMVGLGLQPYFSERGLVQQRKNTILHNGTVIMKMEGDHIEMGRPTLDEDYIYYEANSKLYSPTTWEIWRYSFETKERAKIRNGANPYVYNGKLFYSFWVDGAYEIRCSNLKQV